ncbi:MAG: glycosyltransferase [Deltaproteobacteria bacterium]|nr:glycosyltransferase [Deltaproteobacteria bacterium]
MRDDRLRILLLSGWFPFPPNNGSKIRVANMLRQLSQRHSVTLLSFTEAAPLPQTERFCDKVETVPWREFRPSSWKARFGTLHPTPRSIIDTHSPEMARRIVRETEEGGYDVIVASQITMAAYSSFFGTVPAVFDEVELAVLHDRLSAVTSASRRLRHRMTWLKHRSYLNRLLRRFQACTVASENERQLLLQTAPSAPRIEVIPNAVSCSAYPATPRQPLPRRLIFTGSMTYSANCDAVEWYLHEVHPKVRAAAPGVELLITGSLRPAFHTDQPNVQCTGLVPDVVPLLRSAAISIVPLRIGGGTRLKILEAMAVGTPVVTTSKGCEGLEVEPDRHLIIGDTAESFANAVIALLGDERTAAHLSQQARQLVNERYDWDAIGPRFERFIADVARAGSRPGTGRV